MMNEARPIEVFIRQTLADINHHNASEHDADASGVFQYLFETHAAIVEYQRQLNGYEELHNRLYFGFMPTEFPGVLTVLYLPGRLSITFESTRPLQEVHMASTTAMVD